MLPAPSLLLPAAHLKPYTSLPGPVSWPFIGAALPLLTSRRPSDVLAAWTAKYGPTVRVALPGGKRAVLVTSPALIAEAAALPAVPMPAGGALTGASAPLPTAAHAALAACLGSPDSADAAGAFGATMAACASLVRCLVAAGPNAPVDLADGLDRLALDAAVKGGFGLEAGGLKEGGGSVAKEGFGSCELLSDLRAGVAGLGPLAGLGCPKAGAAAASAPLQSHWKSMAAVLKGRGPPAPADKSVGAALARAGLADADLAAAIGSVVTAATLPISRAAAWALFDLCSEPAVQDKVARELGEAGLLAHGEDRAPRVVTASDAASRLPYLGAVVRESLRVHGVGVPGAGLAGCVRAVTSPEGASLGGVFLPPGTLVAAPPACVHGSAPNFANPSRFSPDRWLEPVKPHTPKAVTEKPGPVLLVGKPKAHGGAPGAFVPFGSGPAACPAQGAALLQVTALVASLVSSFRMRLDDSMGGRKGVAAASEEDGAGARLGAGLKMVFVPRASIGFSADV